MGEANLSEERSEDKMPTWVIAIIVVIGAVLLLVIAILGVVVSREQQGKPIFVQKNSAATSGSSKIRQDTFHPIPLGVRTGLSPFGLRDTLQPKQHFVCKLETVLTTWQHVKREI